MEARHEIIAFDQASPIRLFMHKLGDVSRHWHESLELLFVLAGEVTVLTGDRQTTLHTEDMLMINSNVIHELHSQGCVLIAVQIKLSKFDLPAPRWNSSTLTATPPPPPLPPRSISSSRSSPPCCKSTPQTTIRCSAAAPWPTSCWVNCCGSKQINLPLRPIPRSIWTVSVAFYSISVSTVRSS